MEFIKGGEDEVGVNQMNVMKTSGVEKQDKCSKNSGQIVLNKPVALEGPAKVKMEDKNKVKVTEVSGRTESQQSKNFRKNEEMSDSSRHLRKREDTFNREETDQQNTEQNDIFQSESVGLDLTIDSTAINQFDYNESIDRDD